jgi:hypothetical protein
MPELLSALADRSDASTAVQFYKERLAKEWLSYGLQEQAMIALILTA